jgi:flagellar biosynthesis/type III secretory pathway protein FliH
MMAKRGRNSIVKKHAGLALVAALILPGCADRIEEARLAGYEEGYEEGREQGAETGKEEALDCVRTTGGSAEDAADDCG